CLSPALRERVELHLVDTVGALIASTRTIEGANLLRFRAAMREREERAWALDLATRCALARLSEIDDIHLPSMMTPGAIVIPGALTLAGALPAGSARALMPAILAAPDGMTRPLRARHRRPTIPRRCLPSSFRRPSGIRSPTRARWGRV